MLKLLSLFCIFIAVLGSCPPTEREALIAIYVALKGGDWANTWDIHNPGIDHCSWYGVECSSGRVTAIMLQENNLKGVIPSVIGCFNSLQYLKLQGNMLTGYIPSSIGHLQKLKTLDLSDSLITGRIPTTLCNLYESLQYLNLHNTRLNGKIPECFDVRFSSSLVSFSVHCTSLIGTIPDGFADMRSLRYLTSYCTSMGCAGCTQFNGPHGCQKQCGNVNCDSQCLASTS
ncbi:hypothetical protein P9112_007858 [Eukaryota sp. TZLM1-RC]